MNKYLIALFVLLFFFNNASYAGSCGGDRDINTCKANATQGNTSAQYNLAVMYHRGDNVSKNIKQALYWYREAAKQGLGQAQYNLGLMYSSGDGVPQSNQTAAAWYNQAAKQGVVEAQYNLAVLYANGDGITKNEQKAGRWYFSAAQQGLADAQFELGLIYLQGIGVDKDVVKAHMFFSIASEGGNNKAVVAKNALSIYMSAEEVSKSESLRKTSWRIRKRSKATKTWKK